MSTIKWIDLRDTTTGGRLKVTQMPGSDGRERNYLIVIGLKHPSPRWDRAVELLGFNPSPNNKYLIRQNADGERITAKTFAPVWPNATLVEMQREDAILDLRANKRVREESRERNEEESSISMQMGETIRLGRNSDGEEVFKTPVGRFIRRERGNVQEGAMLNPALFLRAQDEEGLRLCADGFVQAMVLGEVQRSEDFTTFMQAVLDTDAPQNEQTKTQITEAIESAMLRHLERQYDTAQDAYGDAARLYEYLPPFTGHQRGKGAMPLPLSVLAQRLLGDTTDKTVVYPNAFDGASFVFLPRGTSIRAYRGSKDLSVGGAQREGVEWADTFNPAREQAADAMFFNMDPGLVANGTRADYAQALNALRILNPGGRAVIVLAAQDGEDAGEIGPVSRGFYDTLSRRYQIESAIEIPALMTQKVGTSSALRVIALRNRAPAADSAMLTSFHLVYSWDEAKSRVDEDILTIDLKEAESEAIDVERVAAGNDFQRPYIAFSKVGEARTMVPNNLQAPLQAALANLEAVEGPIDAFVTRELGFGDNTLDDRFSPEQVDAIGLAVARVKAGRGMIIADETGVGKGRTLSGLATWAQKQGRNVIFVTDRSNLFSDLARDLRDIDEWGRFQPLIMNADGVIQDVLTKEVLLEGTSPSRMRAIMDAGVSLEETGHNMVMATYSQISGEDSEKAAWLLNQAENSFVIIDEAHVAAGSDSNISRVVLDLATRAWGCVYSSATWAKSSENLHIYTRALSEAINIGALSETMRSGGESFAEVFSGMLARDGALIRREHDLSRLEFSVEVDSNRVERNNKIADAVSEVLGAMTYVGGEINRLLMRSNSDTMNALRAARGIHGEVSSLAARARREARVAQLRRDAAAAEADDDQEGDALRPAPARPVVKGQLFRSSFGAGTVLYQVMRRLLSLLNADHVADLAIQALNANEKPVIVFEETGESFVREIVKENTIPAMEGEKAILPDQITPPTIQDMLYKVVGRMGVVVRREVDSETFERPVAQDDAEVDVDQILTGGEASGAPALRVEDIPGLDEASKEVYLNGMKRIVEMIDKLPPLPLNAIDVVRARLEDAGIRVGEISGRRMVLNVPERLRGAAIDSDWTTEKWPLSFRKKSKPEINNTVHAFNFGHLDAILLNRSGAAGLSLHASPRFDDHRRRVLIEMQIPENPTDRIQLYGRVNRYDQVCGPKLAVASTGVYGETRQLMSQNKKLAKLSANTRSSRENVAEIKHVIDLLNPVGEMICSRFLEENGGIRQRLGITQEEMDNRAFSAATKLTSRLVLLKVAEQKMVYEELYEAYDEEIVRLDLAGENPLRSKEMDIRAKTLQSRIAIGVDMEGLGSAFDGPVYIKEIEWKEDRRPLSWDDVRQLVLQGRQSLLTTGVATVVSNDRAPDSYCRVDEIDWETYWNVGQDANNQARAFLEQREDLERIDQDFAAARLSVLHLAIEEAFGRTSITPAAQLPAGGLHPDDLRVIATDFMQKRGVIPIIDVRSLTGRLATLLDAKMRLDLVGTKFATLDEALAAQGDSPIKRAYAKRLWIEQEMPRLVPGVEIEVDLSNRSRERGRDWLPTRTHGVVTALVPPPKGKEAYLQRWKIEWLAPGDEKVRTISLASYLTDLKIEFMQREGETVPTPSFFNSHGLSDYLFDGSQGSTLRQAFERAPAGVRRRTGHILDGNMYLASEWAQATKNGAGVIYTDERGVRHRAVMLRERILGGDADVFNHLPIRLWNNRMIGGLVRGLVNRWDTDEKLMGNIPDGYALPTSFASAMHSGTRDDRMEFVVFPGRGVALTMERREMARITRALRAEVLRRMLEIHPGYKSYSVEQRKAADEAFIKVSTSAKRGKKPVVMLNAETVEKMEEAVRMTCKAVGLEVYLWPTSEVGRLGQSMVTDYFTEQREIARQHRLERERARRDGAGEPMVEDVEPRAPGMRLAA